MNDVATNFTAGVQQAWANVLLFAPKVILFAVILVVGYFAAKFLCKLFNRILERVGFDRVVERGGIKRALDRTGWDASSLLSKTLFYFVMLFALQLAFGVFGPNPISDLLTRMVAYLPNIFVAAIIIIIAGAVASAVRQIASAALGGLGYGRIVATAAAVAIWTVGIFAALDQLNIAPAIVTGLFYALLAIVAGSAIVAIGGGGIEPMRHRWNKALTRLDAEAPRLREGVQRMPGQAEQQAEKWQARVEQAATGDHRTLNE
jgi:hypothetical protein